MNAADSPDDLNVERSFDRPRRRGLPRRASPRDHDRYREWLAADLRRKVPGANEAQIYDRADAELARIARDYPPGIIAALDRLAPSSRAVSRNQAYFWPELAAALALPPSVAALKHFSRTPSKHGPISDLSGAVASLVLQAGKGGANIARETFDELTTSPAANWALAHPTLPHSDSQRYRGRIVVTGRVDIPGHDPDILIAKNIELIGVLQRLADENGRPCHPRIGEVGLVDAQRLAAPVEQIAPRGAGYMRALRRPGMELVAASTYKHGDQYDTVIGWKLVVVVDQATMLPLVWKFAAGNADERAVLLGDLLPALFACWPDCPMHTLVGDSLYDTKHVCQQLEERYSVHPIFTRPSEERTTVARRGGKDVQCKNGQPYCRCGPMKLRGRGGFYSLEQRLRDGKPRGALAPNTKEACVRWTCQNDLCDPVSLWHQQDYRNHTWWPRGGESKAACERVALEINRNGVESVFAGNKRRGLGTYDMRALSLRDDGAEWVCEWGLYLHTARRVIHETGSYGLFHDEYLELGLHRSGDLPNSELLRQVASRRPKSWQWHWPPSGRATDNRYDAAA